MGSRMLCLWCRDGGGIYADDNSLVVLNGSSLSLNFADNGGAVRRRGPRSPVVVGVITERSSPSLLDSLAGNRGRRPFRRQQEPSDIVEGWQPRNGRVTLTRCLAGPELRRCP